MEKSWSRIKTAATKPLYSETKHIEALNPEHSHSASEVDAESSGAVTPLGEILGRRGQLKPFTLNFLLSLQRAYQRARHPRKLGELLIQHRVIEPEGLESALELQRHLPTESVTAICSEMEFTQSTKRAPSEEPAEGLTEKKPEPFDPPA